MPRVRVALLLLALLPLLPVVGADTQQGATVGVNLGYVAPGAWDVWQYDHFASGAASFELSWAESLFPGADYDLHLYPREALDDGTLTTDEAIAVSATRTFQAHVERLDLSLPAGRYFVAVVPFQTQGEVYTLTALPGPLHYAGVAPGVIVRCQPVLC